MISLTACYILLLLLLLLTIDLTRKPLEDYTVDEVAKYFKEVGMEKYVDYIKEGNIDGEEISNMTLNTLLEEAGIEDHLDCLKICMFISQLKNDKPEALNLEGISKFLHDYKLENLMVAFEQHDEDSSTKSISFLDASRVIVYYHQHLGENYDHELSKTELVKSIKDMKMSSSDTDECIIKIMKNDVSLCMLKQGGKELLCDLGYSEIKAKKLIRKLKF